MSGFEPSPQTTLVILLGASAWPFSNLQSSPAFANSAGRVNEYFCDPSKFRLPPENWLDLFDKRQDSPSEVYQAISTFLEERLSQMHHAGTPARDLLFYYIGHGVFASSYEYHLAIRSTQEDLLRASAIAMATLADILKAKARHLRRIVTLDCCFAAESLRYMQSAPDRLAMQQTISAFAEKSKGQGFPREGTALLCSSSHKEPSFILQDESGTMFSEALVRALSLGYKRQPGKTHFSLHDLKLLTEAILESFPNRNAPKPEVHSPDQHDGDIAAIPFFPNPWAEEKQVLLAAQLIYQPRLTPPLSVTSSAQPPLAPPANSSICPMCGYQNRPGAKFCLRDGQALILSASPTPHSQPVEATPSTVGTTKILEVTAIADALESGAKAGQVSPHHTPLMTDNEKDLTQQGTSLIRRSKFKDALEMFDGAIKINPNFLAAWLGKGICLHTLGRFKEALLAYEQAIKLEPQSSITWIWKGDTLRSLQEYPEALRAYEEALTLDKSNSAIWNSKGDALADVKMYDEALLAYEQALVLNPNFVKALYNKGAILVVQGKTDEALITFDKAIGIAPTDVSLWYGKGLIYEFAGKPNEALSAFDNALAIDAKYKPAWMKKVEILMALKQYREVVGALDEALAIDSQDALAWYEKGKALLLLGLFDEGIGALDRSLALDPNQAEVWDAKGMSLFFLQRYAEALPALDRLLAIKPDYIAKSADNKPTLDQHDIAWCVKGITLCHLKRFEEANEAFDHAIRVAPNYYFLWAWKTVA